MLEVSEWDLSDRADEWNLTTPTRAAATNENNSGEILVLLGNAPYKLYEIILRES
jgi:hypothetical protein